MWKKIMIALNDDMQAGVECTDDEIPEYIVRISKK